MRGRVLPDMLADLPTACDGGMPLSRLLTSASASASTHDSQVAIPLAYMTSEWAVNRYGPMDSAYDVPHLQTT
ncbi:hypothetical protein [Nitrosomonas sp.]|uniref:hypothetical protein n=1 Tax=Nitrosomonas sp. TaxID=42353 RepID=UPI00261E9D4B|nr:hypothetical protein [Nitrosomonas sp.]MCW5602268.1 hypothetical protein [Nitrosomonas sp.]